MATSRSASGEMVGLSLDGIADLERGCPSPESEPSRRCLHRKKVHSYSWNGRESHGLSKASRGSWFASRRSEEHTSELQSRLHLVCRLLLEKKNCDPESGPGDRRQLARPLPVCETRVAAPRSAGRRGHHQRLVAVALQASPTGIADYVVAKG